jgi:hypothetical protein
MARRPYKKESEERPKKPSRSMRKNFLEILDDISERSYPPKFKIPQKYDFTEEDGLIGVRQVFDRAGLDVRAPGHWQQIVIQFVSHVWPAWNRYTTSWSYEQRIDFLFDLNRQRTKVGNVGLLKLCKSLREENPKGYPAEGPSLRVEAQKTLRDLRQRVRKGTATPSEKRLADLFPLRTKRKRRL